MILQIAYMFYFIIINILYPIDLLTILIRVKLRTGWNYQEICNQYFTIYKHCKNIVKPTYLHFTLMKSGLQTELQASFQSCFGINYILATQEWLIRLIISDKAETHNAFLITLGHEMTHNEKEFSLKGISRKDRKFINWVNEVHADFGAAQKMANSSREILIQSMKYKLSLKKKDVEDSSHPSWARRLEYATNYNFDEVLIRRIAADASASASLLQPLIMFFQPIVLS